MKKAFLMAFVAISMFLSAFSTGQGLSISVGFDSETSVLREMASPDITLTGMYFRYGYSESFEHDLVRQETVYLVSDLDEVWYESASGSFFYTAHTDACPEGPRIDFKLRQGAAAVTVTNTTGLTIRWVDPFEVVHILEPNQVGDFPLTPSITELWITRLDDGTQCAIIGVDKAYLP